MAEKFTLHKIAVAGISGDKDWRGLARIVKFNYRLFGIKAKSIESELRAGGAVGRAAAVKVFLHIIIYLHGIFILH